MCQLIYVHPLNNLELPTALIYGYCTVYTVMHATYPKLILLAVHNDGGDLLIHKHLQRMCKKLNSNSTASSECQKLEMKLVTPDSERMHIMYGSRGSRRRGPGSRQAAAPKAAGFPAFPAGR